MGDMLLTLNADEKAKAKATALVENRIRVIQEAVDASVAMHEMMSPRFI